MAEYRVQRKLIRSQRLRFVLALEIQVVRFFILLYLCNGTVHDFDIFIFNLKKK